VPIYEYLCEDCGKITETLQKLSEPPPKTCGECGGKHIAKLVSRSAFQLKGGGWYSDLYSSPKKRDSESAPAADAPADASKPGDGAAKPAPEKKPEKAEPAAKAGGDAKSGRGAKSGAAGK